MTNFFDEQDRARRQSRRLLLGFFVAVVLIFLLLYALTVTITEAWNPSGEYAYEAARWWWDAEVFLFVLIAHSIIVGGGTLLKISELRGGGGAVARMMGGREIDPATTNPDERRLINVVEEMAIASGTPVPAIFVLDHELGMNAFAAGYGLHDAAVAVTRGGLRGWTRDELQGVMAHEFSHILNGDMRLNIRLIGLLNGLLGIAMLGTMLLRSGRAIAASQMGRASRNNPAAAALLIVLLGLAIWLIGSLGVLAGRLLKAGISREREYLADASAVQFTRNPSGIAGALRKVGGYDMGARIEHPMAEETSHLFFGHALSSGFFGGLLATHPPLKDRIRRIDPGFHGAFNEFKLPPEPASSGAKLAWTPETYVAASSGLVGGGPQAAGAQMAQALTAKQQLRESEGDGPALPDVRPAESYAIPLAAQGEEAKAEHFVHTIGAPAFRHLRYGGSVLQEIPPRLREAARDPVGAIAIVWSLLMDRNPARRDAQMEVLQALEGADAILLGMADLGPEATEIAPHLRLPLLDLCLPTLNRLGDERIRRFLRVADELTSRSEGVSVFRFALRKILHVHLESDRARHSVRYQALAGVAPDLMVLLSVLARIGHEEESEVRAAFEEGVRRLQGLPKQRISMLPPESCTFLRLDRALDRLAMSSPGIKRRAVDACAHAIMADGEVTIEEAELLRAIGEVLDCPVPPFLPRAETAAA